jgi:hypothetical protein
VSELSECFDLLRKRREGARARTRQSDAARLFSGPVRLQAKAAPSAGGKGMLALRVAQSSPHKP